VDVLVKEVEEEVEEIVVYDAHTYAAVCDNLESAAADLRVTVRVGRVQDGATLLKVLQHHAITGILHLAAESHVDNSWSEEGGSEFTSTNVMGTVSVMNALRAYNADCAERGVPGVQRFVHMSTDEVYGTCHDATEEDGILNPANPYAASKCAAEMYVQSYVHSKWMELPEPYVPATFIVRCNNVYGPRQHPEKVIPSWSIRLAPGSMDSEREIRVHGSGAQTRTFLHVRDAARGIWSVFTSGQPMLDVEGGTRVYHLAGTHEISMLELAHTMLERSPASVRDATSIVHVADRFINDQRYDIRDALTREHTGWAPRVKWVDGLAETMAWYAQRTHEWWAQRALRSPPLPAPPRTERMKTDLSTTLVWGATGWVGGHMTRLLRDTGVHSILPCPVRLDAPVKDTVQWMMRTRLDLMSTRPVRHVLIAAGLTGRPNVGALEATPEAAREAVRVNVLGTMAVITTAVQLGWHVTFVGTGCIYATTSDTQAPFTEEDVPNFTGSHYSRLKVWAQGLMATLPNVLVARLRMPFDNDASHPRSIIKKLRNYSKIIDVVNSMSHLPTLLPILVHMMQRRVTGTINLVNPGTLAHTDIKALYPHEPFEIMSQEEHDACVTGKRSTTTLDTTKLQKYCETYGMPLPTAKACLGAVTLELEANVVEDTVV
jgi:dTDP-glucose 4,6-dehydratase